MPPYVVNYSRQEWDAVMQPLLDELTARLHRIEEQAAYLTHLFSVLVTATRRKRRSNRPRLAPLAGRPF